MKIVKKYVCEYTEENFDDLTELIELLEGILKDKQDKLASKLCCLGYSELMDNIFDDDVLNLFEDVIKINKEIEQCNFILENENSAPC